LPIGGAQPTWAQQWLASGLPGGETGKTDGQSGPAGYATNRNKQHKRRAESQPSDTEQEPQKWFYNWGEDLDPYLRALTGRTAYLGLKGTLLSNGSDWKGVLANAGPVGAQLTERMKMLEGKGWSFGTLGITDPYWDMTRTSLPARLGKMLYVGGYHADMFDGRAVKRIAINDKIVSLSNMISGAYGRADAPRGIATLMAHELSHEDGILRDHPGEPALLPAEEQKTLARRLLATEARATLTQLHVADITGDTTLTNARARAAMQAQDLGGLIHERWLKFGNKYDSFRAISRQEAKDFVNDYIAETFGPDVIDTGSGRVRAFDINAGLDKQIGSITGDAELSESMKVAQAGARPLAGNLSRFLLESNSGRALLHGGQALGALGLLVAANDLDGAFRQGADKGLGRLSRVGLDWGGFEAGTAGGELLVRGLAETLGEKKLALAAIPLIIMAGGMLGSHWLDRQLGNRLEAAAQKTVSLAKRWLSVSDSK
jgi:hypothetical protein